LGKGNAGKTEQRELHVQNEEGCSKTGNKSFQNESLFDGLSLVYFLGSRPIIIVLIYFNDVATIMCRL